ncbi:MAG: hypothetical protein AMXMBFR64_05070 [Myxococcales bacterium]
MYADEVYEAVAAAIEGIQLPVTAKAHTGDRFVRLPPGSLSFPGERAFVLEGGVPSEHADMVLLDQDNMVVGLQLGVGYLSGSEASTKRALRDTHLILGALLALEAVDGSQIAHVQVQGQAFLYQAKILEVSYLISVRYDPRTP